MSQSGSACFASTVTGVQSLELMGKAAEQGSMCHRLSAGQAEAGGPGLLACQPSLFGELQARTDSSSKQTNKEEEEEKKKTVETWSCFLASVYLGCGSVVEWLLGMGKALGSILHTI